MRGVDSVAWRYGGMAVVAWVAGNALYRKSGLDSPVSGGLSGVSPVSIPALGYRLRGQYSR